MNFLKKIVKLGRAFMAVGGVSLILVSGSSLFSPVMAGQKLNMELYPVKNALSRETGKPKKIMQGSFRDVLTPATEIEPVEARRPVKAARQDRWQVFRGADIRDVLELWSEEAGVNFVWRASGRVNVLKTMSLRGRYEDAVRRLLEQYDGLPSRPVASLHIDDTTGERTLVVQIDGALAF